jgi:hypothetical protein
LILIPRPSVLLLPPVAMEGGDTMYDTDRSSYVEAIVKLLEKADLRALRLIWLHAKGLTR